MPPASVSPTTRAAHSFRYESSRNRQSVGAADRDMRSIRGSDSFVRHPHAVAPLQPFRDRKSLLAQAIQLEQLRIVARAEIRENRNDGVAWPHLLSEPDRAGDVDAGR